MKTRGILPFLLTSALLLSSCGGSQQNNVTHATTTVATTTQPVSETTTVATTTTSETTTVATTTAETTVAVTTESLPETTQNLNDLPAANDLTFEEIETFEILNENIIVLGLLNRQSTGYAASLDRVISIEADYGFTEVVVDNDILLRFYNHTDDNIKITSAYVEKVNEPDVKFDIEFDGTCDHVVQTDDLSVGTYRITANFSTGNDMHLCFRKTDERVYACMTYELIPSEYESTRSKKILFGERRELLDKILKDGESTDLAGGFALDGSKSLQLDKFYYPNYPYEDGIKYRCDTQRWIELANEIVEPDWSAEHKAFVLAEWLRNNIAYDRFAADFDSRCIAEQDWTGTYSVYNIRAGVCWDFGNIYTLMCRSQGIPCTTIGANEINHMWNIVMINGKWIELDISDGALYCAPSYDYTTRYIPDSNTWSEFAFIGLEPHNRFLQDNVYVNVQLMYGDHTDKSQPVHFLY